MSVPTILGYVASTMPRRTFLACDAERRAPGLPTSRRVKGAAHRLLGVGDLAPGLIELIPDAATRERLRRMRREPPPADQLAQPPTLTVLVARLRQLGEGVRSKTGAASAATAQYLNDVPRRAT